MSHRQVALENGVAQSSVTCWAHLKATTGDTVYENHAGRHPKLSVRDLRHLHRLISRNRRANHQQILALLEEVQIKICESTLRHVMKDFGLHRRKARMKPWINDDNRQRRLAYAREHMGDTLDDWRRTIYVDEASVKLNGTIDVWVTREDGEAFMAECLAPKLLGGSESIMVWGAIWYNGRSDLVVFDKEGSEGKRGGVTAKMYREQIMQGELKRNWREVNGSWRGYGGARIVEDNARIHTAKENMEMRRKEKLVYVEHPPYSPDLNPIENCWSYLKGMLARRHRHATTTAELSQ